MDMKSGIRIYLNIYVVCLLFAIYDKNKNEVFLARDNFGIKPLYYAKMNDTFYVCIRN